MRTSIVTLVFFGVVSAWAATEPQQGGPIVLSVEGDHVIVVIKSDGKNATAERGTRLDVGDHLRTGPHTSAVIKYVDGSKLFLGRGTDVVLGKNNGETQWNEISYGQVRGMVPKPKGAYPSGPPRFAVRSRAAVMGVRGTDFVFQAAEGLNTAEVHTLEGLVEVAKDDASLLAGNSVKIREGQSVSADGDKIDAVKKFNKDKYLKEFEYQQPEVMAMVRSDPDARPQTLVAAQEAVARTPAKNYGRTFRPWLFSASAYVQTELKGAQFRDPFLTGHLSWNPSMRVLWSLLHVRAHLGGAFLKSQTDGKIFPTTQLALLPAVHLFDFIFAEAGGGIETWWAHGKTSALLMANAGILLNSDGFFERIFVGASLYPQDGGGAGPRAFFSVRAGIGFQIPPSTQGNADQQQRP